MLIHSRQRSILERRQMFCVCAIALAAVACEREYATVDDSERVLVRSSDSTPSTLIPNLAVDSGSIELARDIFEGLYSREANGELILAGATTAEVSDDGLQVFFELRPNARWSNGDPVTAQDYVRALRFAANPSNAAPQAGLLESISGFAAIQTGSSPSETLQVFADSDYQLRIELSEHVPHLLSLFEYPLTYPMHAESTASEPISNGPYRLNSQATTSGVDLVKNEYYWNADSLPVTRVRYVNVTDESALLSRFRAGEIHLTATVPTRMIGWIKENLADSLIASPQLAVYYYAFDTTSGPTADPAVREALNISVNRSTLVDEVLQGGQAPAYSLVPDGMPNYTTVIPNIFKQPISERIRRAKQLLYGRGYNDENPLKLRLLYNSGNNHDRIAIFVASEWEHHLPVTIVLEKLEFRVLLQAYKNREDWDLVRSSWTADYPDPYNFLQIFSSRNPNNISGFTSAQVDEQLQSADAEFDPTKRLAGLRTAEIQLLESHPAIFLYRYVDLRLASDALAGFDTNSLGIVRSAHLSWASQ